MNVVEFSWLCVGVGVLILLGLFSIPVVHRSLTLLMFGADSADIRIANTLHRNADKVPAYEVFHFPVASAPRLAVGLVRATAEAFRVQDSYTLRAFPEAWAARVMYHFQPARRFSVDESAALISAFAACDSIHSACVEEFLTLVLDDPLLGAAYLRAVGDIDKASAGLRAGLPAEYAALV